MIEGDTACYVAKVTSLNDKTATETKKQSMITDKQDKYYKKVLKKWKKKKRLQSIKVAGIRLALQN